MTEFTPPEGGTIRQSKEESATKLLSPSAASNPDSPDLETRVSEDIDAARETVMQAGEAATDKVKDAMTEQKNFAAHQVGGIASALEKVGAELEQSDQPHVGRYAREIGTSVQAFAKQLEGKDLGEVAAMAEEYGRKQPLAFLGVAALAGLAASRFLTASSQRDAKPSPTGPSSRTTAAEGGKDHG